MRSHGLFSRFLKARASAFINRDKSTCDRTSLLPVVLREMVLAARGPSLLVGLEELVVVKLAKLLRAEHAGFVFCCHWQWAVNLCCFGEDFWALAKIFFAQQIIATEAAL